MQFYPFAMKKLCDTWAWQRVGLEKSGQSQNNRYEAWQVGLQPCASTGLHALCYEESDSCCGVWTSTTRKIHPFSSQLQCRLFSKKAIWLSSFCIVLSQSTLRKLYTFS